MTEHAAERVVVVRDDPDDGAYVVEVDGAQVGKAVYHIRGGRHLFVHTEVDHSQAGKGIGTILVRESLDDVRANGGKVVPVCPFFAAYIARHPEYDDIVDHEITDRINAKRESG